MKKFIKKNQQILSEPLSAIDLVSVMGGEDPPPPPPPEPIKK